MLLACSGVSFRKPVVRRVVSRKFFRAGPRVQAYQPAVTAFSDGEFLLGSCEEAVRGLEQRAEIRGSAGGAVVVPHATLSLKAVNEIL